MIKVKDDISRRRSFGEHLTSVDIFKEFIFPQIKDKIYDYCWVDLFCGEGNLILPILNEIKPDKREEFFKEHIYLFDVQEQMVKKSILNAIKLGISRKIATKNIKQRDTLLRGYPECLKKQSRPVFHITNPPYLYLGYIVKHRKEDTGKQYTYFEKEENKGLQDLYQIALMNDLRQDIKDLIYVLPSNLLFSASGANKIRQSLFPFYSIKEAFIFEKKIFDFTGTNVCICHFERKKCPANEPITFEAMKFNKIEHKRKYILKPEGNFRAGGEFTDFVNKYRCDKPLKISYYLMSEAVKNNVGNHSVSVIDTNNYSGNKYQVINISVNNELYEKIIHNPLFIRTVDTGTMEGRAGLFYIRNIYSTDGALVSGNPYRTNPIQVFIEPFLNKNDTELLLKYFNCILEYFREITDGEFLTTYKYSESCPYIRKYLGLSQTKKIIETFPINKLDDIGRGEFERVVLSNSGEEIINVLDKLKSKSNNFLEAQ